MMNAVNHDQLDDVYAADETVNRENFSLEIACIGNDCNSSHKQH